MKYKYYKLDEDGNAIDLETNEKFSTEPYVEENNRPYFPVVGYDGKGNHIDSDGNILDENGYIVGKYWNGNYSYFDTVHIYF